MKISVLKKSLAVNLFELPLSILPLREHYCPRESWSRRETKEKKQSEEHLLVSIMQNKLIHQSMRIFIRPGLCNVIFLLQLYFSNHSNF